jgi:hypothetical protein
LAVVVRNRFYFSIALALALLLTLGFTRTFYARPLFDLPPLPTLVQIHGVVFTAWFLLFIAQTRLVAARNFKAHMTLGAIGAVIAVLMIVVGTITAFGASINPRPRIFGMTSAQFVVIPLVDIVLFTIFVGAALALRKRAALHKRFMVLAMISVLGPAIGRALRLVDLSEYYLLAQCGIPALFVAWGMINDWRKNHIVHPVFVIGGLVIVISWPLRIMLGQSEAWTPVAGWIVRHAV